MCKNGLHDITGDGSIYIDSEGVARCRACRVESRRRWARKQAAKGVAGNPD
jgi:ferredoxin-like protein FixX